MEYDKTYGWSTASERRIRETLAKIDPADVVSVAIALAQESPDFVYNGDISGGCEYTPDANNPQGCIVGAALSALGVRPDILKAMNQGHATSITSWVGHGQAGGWENVQVIQERQDGGRPWSEAVDYSNGTYGDDHDEDES